MEYRKLQEFNSIIEAEQAKSFLESHGIDCKIPDKNTHSITTYSLALGYVKLLVRRDHYFMAKNLLKETEISTHKLSSKIEVHPIIFLKKAKSLSLLALALFPIAPLLVTFSLTKLISFLNNKGSEQFHKKDLLIILFSNALSVIAWLFILSKFLLKN